MASWDAIKSQIDIIRRDASSLTLPEVGDLDRYESSSGFRLPLDYRDFVLAFGLGRFEPGSWYFAVPGFPGEALSCDLEGMTDFVRGGFGRRSDEELAKEFDDPQRARRLLIFCGTASNDFYGWDPLDVADPEGHEYGIYQLGRYDTRVLRLATTFRDFVLGYCFRGVLRRDGSGYDREKLPEEWEPDDLPFKFFVERRDD